MVPRPALNPNWLALILSAGSIKSSTILACVELSVIGRKLLGLLGSREGFLITGTSRPIVKISGTTDHVNMVLYRAASWVRSVADSPCFRCSDVIPSSPGAQFHFRDLIKAQTLSSETVTVVVFSECSWYRDFT